MQGTISREGAGSARGDRFDRAPRIAIWEVTRACDLACMHCRAEAIPERETGELTTDEMFAGSRSSTSTVSTRCSSPCATPAGDEHRIEIV